MKKTIIFTLIASVLVIFAGCTAPTDDSDNNQTNNSNNNSNNNTELDLSQECQDANGKWLEEYNECEGISEQECQELGGQYDNCASACRHDPNSAVCTMQCVMVCSFE